MSAQGAITHQDSLGNEGRTEAGDVQVMSAGSGIRHAEYNLEPVPTTLFQIWIEPGVRGGEPSWGAKPFPKADRSGRFVALACGRRRQRGAADQGRGAGARRHAAGRPDRRVSARARAVTAISCRRSAASRSTACVSARATAQPFATRRC